MQLELALTPTEPSPLLQQEEVQRPLSVQTPPPRRPIAFQKLNCNSCCRGLKTRRSNGPSRLSFAWHIQACTECVQHLSLQDM